MKNNNLTYELADTKEKVPTLLVSLDDKMKPVHSKFYPTKDSSIFDGMFTPEKYDVLILLGTGLGYHLLPIKEILNQYSKIICIDILGGVENLIKDNAMTSFLFDSELVQFITGQSVKDIGDMVAGILDLSDIKGISVLEHPFSARNFQEYYGEIRKEIDKVINKKAGNEATKKKFGLRYIKNIILKLKDVNQLKPVSDIFNICSGYPALILSSAPSLDLYIEKISRKKDNFFIVAVDSVLPVLQSFDILPDFIVSIDPQPYILEHIQGFDFSGTNVITSISSTSLLNSFDSEFVSLNTHPLSQIIEEVSGDTIGSIDSRTGSVAGDAVSLAVKTGFSQLGIVGFDFSFPKYEIYAQGTAYQNRYAHFLNNRFAPVETSNLQYIMKASNGYRVEGKLTRKSFAAYRNSLSEFITANEIKNVYTINDLGLQVPGLPGCSFDDFLASHCTHILDKKNILLPLKQKKFNNVIPIDKFKDLLRREDVFDQMIIESLGSEVKERDADIISKLISGL